MGTILLVILILLLLGAVPYGGGPGWHGFGYYAPGGLGLVLIVVLILVLLGRL